MISLTLMQSSVHVKLQLLEHYLGVRCAAAGVEGWLMLLASARRLAGGVTASSASSLPTEILCEAGVPDCPASLAESARIWAILLGRRPVLILASAGEPGTVVPTFGLSDTANSADPAASLTRVVVTAG